MKRKRFSFSVLALFVTLTLAACGGGGGDDDDDDDDNDAADDAAITATDAEGAAAVDVTGELAIEALNASLGALTLEGDEGLLADALKRQIVVTETGSCSEGSLPSCSSPDVTDTLAGDNGGSCTLEGCGDLGETSGDINGVLSCTNYSDTDTVDSTTYTVTLNGSIGADISYEDEGDSGSVCIDTDNFTATIAGDNTGTCSLVVNLCVDWSNGGSTISADGCLCLCGECFDVSGTETF